MVKGKGKQGKARPRIRDSKKIRLGSYVQRIDDISLCYMDAGYNVW